MLQKAGLPFDGDELRESTVPLQDRGIPLPPCGRTVMIQSEAGDVHVPGKVSTHFNERGSRPMVEVQYHQTPDGGNNTQFVWNAERQRYESPGNRGHFWLDLSDGIPDPTALIFRFCPACGTALVDDVCVVHGAP